MPAAGKPGFRVLPSADALAPDLLAWFAGVASATLADAMGRFNFMDEGIRSRTGLTFAAVLTELRT
jgi:hypothetical protein